MLTNIALQRDNGLRVPFALLGFPQAGLFFSVRHIGYYELYFYKVLPTTGPVACVVTAIDNRLKSPIV